MSALALRQPNGNATFKRLIPILLVLLLVSAVTITAQNWSQPILDLIAVITGLDDLINSLNRSIENLEKKLPGLQSLETKFGKDYERGSKIITRLMPSISALTPNLTWSGTKLDRLMLESRP